MSARTSRVSRAKTDDLGLKVPNRYSAMYQRAMRGKSRAAAVRCFCVQCMGWDATVVAECTASGCPLYPYRNKDGGL